MIFFSAKNKHGARDLFQAALQRICMVLSNSSSQPINGLLSCKVSFKQGANIRTVDFSFAVSEEEKNTTWAESSPGSHTHTIHSQHIQPPDSYK